MLPKALGQLLHHRDHPRQVAGHHAAYFGQQYYNPLEKKLDIASALALVLTLALALVLAPGLALALQR